MLTGDSGWARCGRGGTGEDSFVGPLDQAELRCSIFVARIAIWVSRKRQAPVGRLHVIAWCIERKPKGPESFLASLATLERNGEFPARLLLVW